MKGGWQRVLVNVVGCSLVGAGLFLAWSPWGLVIAGVLLLVA